MDRVSPRAALAASRCACDCNTAGLLSYAFSTAARNVNTPAVSGAAAALSAGVTASMTGISTCIRVIG